MRRTKLSAEAFKTLAAPSFQGGFMSEAVTMTINLPEFEKAIRDYAQEHESKTMPQILNKRGRNIASKASNFTPRATAAKISEDLSKPSGRPGYGPWLFVLTNARRKAKGEPSVGGQAMSEPATKFKNARRSHGAYIAAGWVPAIVKFGGHRSPGHGKAILNGPSAIDKAYNKPATAGDLVALLENTARGSGDVGAQALQRAIEYDIADMRGTGSEELRALAKKYSGKKS
jgi:hypothetical protein